MKGLAHMHYFFTQVCSSLPKLFYILYRIKFLLARINIRVGHVLLLEILHNHYENLPMEYTEIFFS